jgi:hypothetical protein
MIELIALPDVAEPFDALAIRRVERLLVAAELHARARRLREQGHTLRADAVAKAANGIALSAKRIGAKVVGAGAA